MPRMATSMIIRLVAGLVLGPGTFARVPFVVFAALRVTDLNLRVLALTLPLPARRRCAAVLLLAAEVDRDHVRSVVRLGNGLAVASFRRTRRVVFRIVVRGRFHVGGRRLELQPEVDRRIDK